MTARVFALPTVFVALFAAVGSPATGDKPAAPAPRPGAEKTPVELLVGTWREVTFNGLPVPPDRAARIEFARDGTFVVCVNDPQNGNAGTKRGTYALRDDTLRLTGRAKTDAGMSWVWRIVSVTGDDLVTAEPPGSDSRRDVAYQRVKE